jgi:hypothetical protein
MSTPVDDPYWVPNVEVIVNEDGTTIVIGYPSSGTSGSYGGVVGTDPNEGVGIGIGGDEGGSEAPVPEAPGVPE